MVDSASALLDGGGTNAPRSTLLDVLRDGNGRTTCDLRRALVDVTTADVGGLAAPAYVPLGTPPPRPLLTMARPFGDSMRGAPGSGGRVSYHVPVVTGMPAANVDTPEKTDPTQTGRLTITEDQIFGHQVDVRVDISMAAMQRTAQPEAIEAQLLAAVASAAEAEMVADLAAAATGAAPDLLSAVSLALDFGAPVVVIADGGAWPSAAKDIAPLAMASPGSIILVPVAGSTVGAVVAPMADLMLYADPVTRLLIADPLRLGNDLALSLHVLAALGHPAYSTHIPPGP